MRQLFILFSVLALLMSGLQAEEPALPAGLLLDGLPMESTGSFSPTEDEGEVSESFVDLSGSFDFRLGSRVYGDSRQKQFTIGEARTQLSARTNLESVNGVLTTDFLYDPVDDPEALDLPSGKGFIDLREAYFFHRPFKSVDVKVGRQVLTWGTGEFLFINDLFPKDFRSFFIWRDLDYLKAPSDAARVGFFSDVVNVDFVYTPQFDSNRFIDGSRLSFFNRNTGELSGRDMQLQVNERSSWFREDEFALRLYKVMNGIETSLYAYRGYWKDPVGNEQATGRARFPRLAVYGASVRGSMLGGIASAEIGYYDSLENRSARDPDGAPSEFRTILLFDKEYLPEFWVSFQYYFERIKRFSAFSQAASSNFANRDRYRHVATTRITKFLMQQKLRLCTFVMVGLTESDALVRTSVEYELTDSTLLGVYSNMFLGAERSTFLGQFEQASNVVTALRYSF